MSRTKPTRPSHAATSRRPRGAVAFALALVLAVAPASAGEPKDAGPKVAASTAPAEIERVLGAINRGDAEGARAALADARSAPKADLELASARLALLVGKYEDAQKHAAAAAKADGRRRAEAAAVRAEALAATGKLDDAIAALREVESDPTARRARLQLGELLIVTGKRKDARGPLMTIIDDYNTDAITSKDAEGLSLVGRAAHLLRSPRDANDAYNAAEKAGAKERVETLLWRADLFLEKYNPGAAGEVVKEAQKLAPTDPKVRIMMARVKLENAMDFHGAEEELEAALVVNPNLTQAYFVRAGLALRDLDIEAADKAADRGLSINPTDLELLSMKAAIRFLADDKQGFEDAKKKVFDRNATYSRVYQIIGEYAEWEHRYEDIVSMMEEATKLDPKDAKALAQLGLNLIRAGREEAGVKALDGASKMDPFNVRVHNTLNLFERDIATDYVTIDEKVFRIRYHKSEKAILERYVPPMLKQAWGSMVKRYGFTPKTPVSIELYADDEHFSVRTSGLPNVGIQGVCFGQTLAALSPAAAPFNWGNVLWHELGHVFAIQMSKNHVPRWFTEGLSEYETIIQRKEWQREEDPALYSALAAGRIPPIEGFNRAFTHVDSIEEVTMAYYAASQTVVFIAEKYGFDKVVAMLPHWGKGERTRSIIQGVLGVSPEELDKNFRAWLKPRLARYEKQFVPGLPPRSLDAARAAAKADPKNARLAVDLALALLAEGQQPEAEAVLKNVLDADPKQPDALYTTMRLALAAKKLDDAESIARKMIEGGHDGYPIRMRLADFAENREDSKAMQTEFEAAHKLDPSQPEPLQGLVDLASKVKDGAGELDALRRLAAVDQHDRRVWGRLLEALVARGMWAEAVKVGESAMFIDVANPEVHRLYARALARSGRHLSAVFEYNSAIVAGADPAMSIEIYGELAKAYDKHGDKALATTARNYEAEMKRRATLSSSVPD